MTLPGEEHGAVIMNIAAPMAQYVKRNDLGVVYGAETGFQIERDPDTVMGPDVAFVAKDRVEKTGITKGYSFGAPDLVVEVNSPGDSKRKIEQKVAALVIRGRGFGLGSRSQDQNGNSLRRRQSAQRSTRS